ncbi:MAG TPA: hypothetical protein VF063_05365 [Gaiellaceae bacterium]
MAAPDDTVNWAPEERARLVEHRQKATESFDRTVLTLSGGALGVTITFIHELAPHPRHVWLIGVAWSLFCASLLLILVSYLASIAAHDNIIEQMDRRVAAIKPPRRFTTWFNRAAAALLVSGVAWVVAFAWFNVHHVG